MEFGASRYIDLNQCASLLNRKGISQQRLVPVQVSLDCGTGDDHTSLTTGTKMIWGLEALPNTYTIRKSWLLAKEMFLEATKEERAVIKVARWNDFKVHYDRAHLSQGFLVNLLPDMVRVDGTTPLQTTGWEASQIADRETTNELFYGFFGTTDPLYFGMLDQYQISMEASQASPDPIGSYADVPYADIISQIDPEDAVVLQQINETPPYDPQALQINPQKFHVGWQNASGAMSPVSYVQSSTPFFIAPSGLLKLTNESGEGLTHTGSLRINLMAGSDRGIETGGYK